MILRRGEVANIFRLQYLVVVDINPTMEEKGARASLGRWALSAVLVNYEKPFCIDQHSGETYNNKIIY